MPGSTNPLITVILDVSLRVAAVPRRSKYVSANFWKVMASGVVAGAGVGAGWRNVPASMAAFSFVNSTAASVLLPMCFHSSRSIENRYDGPPFGFSWVTLSKAGSASV